MDKRTDELIDELDDDDTKVDVKCIMQMLRFYTLSIVGMSDDDADSVKGIIDFMAELDAKIVYLCARAPMILVPIIAALIEDDWLREQVNRFEDDDVYRIVVMDKDEEERP